MKLGFVRSTEIELHAPADITFRYDFFAKANDETRKYENYIIPAIHYIIYLHDNGFSHTLILHTYTYIFNANSIGTKKYFRKERQASIHTYILFQYI